MNVVLVGDSSSHGGTVVSSNQSGTFTVGGGDVAVEGALHSCPIQGHGITAISAVTIKSFHEGKLILTKGAVAGCGASITPPSRGVSIE